MKIKIVADENIPYVQELFSPLGELSVLPGRTISSKDLSEHNVLLVRSVTKVDHALLADANVEFVGTCTIGTDHLDTDFLEKQGITYTSAPGCNANAVVQYALTVLSKLNMLDKAGQKKAVVFGGGNVGGRVYGALSAMGLNCSIYDPFLDESCGRKLTRFESISTADIVSLHTPLTKSGQYPTYHMIDKPTLLSLKQNAVLISAGRGAVVNNRDLLEVLDARPDLRVVLDVWENEPNMDPTLLAKVKIGSPHIAGYSFEGRLNGALMVFDALVKHLAVDHVWAESLKNRIVEKALGPRENISVSDVNDAVLMTYDPERDDANLRRVASDLPGSFDWLRKNYPVRREFSHYNVRCEKNEVQIQLDALGFHCG